MKTEIYSYLHEALHFVISSTSRDFMKSKGTVQYSQKPLLDFPKLQRVKFSFSHNISAILILILFFHLCGPGSSVGIANDYELDGMGIETRWGRDFPPIQTGPRAHPASCTMGTGSFQGVKCGRGVLLTTHPLLAPRSWKSRADGVLNSGHKMAAGWRKSVWVLCYPCH